MKRIFEFGLHFHKNKGFTLFGALFLVLWGPSQGKTQGNSHPTVGQPTSCMATTVVNIVVLRSCLVSNQ